MTALGSAARPEPQSFERVLSSMCTEPHPAAREAATHFLATNPGDPDTYPAVAALEREVVSMLGDVVDHQDPTGYVATGGTEANIQAVRAARNLAATDDPNVVGPESLHFSFQKAADVLDVDLRLAPVDEDYRADVDAIADRIDDDTVLVVGIAGTTEYGRVDPIPALSDVARDADARFHVDAAWGGFALPFTDEQWNFAHADIDTMTIDPHKLGQAAIPAGGFIATDERTLDALAVDTPYLESTGQATLTGTRSGAGVASAHAALSAQWPDGYRENYETGMNLATWFAEEMRVRGYDVVSPHHPIVAVDIPTGDFEALTEAGWRLARTSAGELRVVMMPHVTRDSLAGFLADVDDLASSGEER
ncbi:tyrosine decarboxylase MfnA [Halanaeroarchaeum sulfurireducens]|uniref:Probable L-aspartate decarboxylase n=1 Tax=Halanaeroarchaeum sulfurireducens TaxID=1604004 RepID=A0A0F7PCV2_9EURY|nr:tyrosine decarboxylase MfnA [Halanaeroarchaeum sulfurireducens]AKH97138.1 L-tyrosine decarboxylase [Halanaeroarchaeum sulfurireducens]